MAEEFLVPVQRDASNHEKAFVLSKEKFKRLIQNKNINEIIDIGLEIGTDFLSSHIMRVSCRTGKTTQNVIAKLKEDLKIPEEEKAIILSKANTKLEEYKTMSEDDKEISFYFSMLLFGTWQKYLLCRLVLPRDFYSAKNLGIVLNAYTKEGLFRVVKAIASGSLIVDGEDFLIV